jgi:hypothetical protein
MSDSVHFVTTARPRSGQALAAAKWWRDKGQSFFASMPGVKGVTAYAVQFGLGGEYSVEIWQEIDGYAALDKWATEFRAQRQNYDLFGEFLQLYEVGPTRILGRWPEMRL